MSSALVINVVPLRTNGALQQVMLVLETPIALPDVPADGINLVASADQPPFANLMKEPFTRQMIKDCGAALFESLDTMPLFHKTNLEIAVRTPIYFKLDSPPAENLPWEALWHRGRGVFVALEKNWPLARLATANNRPPVSLIEPELKILIVLAASRGDGPVAVDATGEWNAIWKALSTVPCASKLRVHVLSCQDSILETIGGLVDPPLKITCAPLASEQTLQQTLAVLSPNIVHFFCHGSTDGDEPRLNLATRGDYDAEQPTGRVWLGLNELAPLGRSPSAWLVTLNCCQGAQAAGRRSSIASKIAATVPTVVAMRESVDFRKASLFAGAFYDHLLRELEQYIPSRPDAAAGREFTIPESVWVDAMHPPRKALSNAGDEDPAWTLPVVYVQRGALMMKAQPRSASVFSLLPQTVQNTITGLRMGVDQLRGLLATMKSANAPASATLDLEASAVTVLRQADVAERDALIDYVQTPGLPAWHVKMAQERLDDLQTRLA